MRLLQDVASWIRVPSVRAFRALREIYSPP